MTDICKILQGECDGVFHYAPPQHFFLKSKHLCALRVNRCAADQMTALSQSVVAFAGLLWRKELKSLWTVVSVAFWQTSCGTKKRIRTGGKKSRLVQRRFVWLKTTFAYYYTYCKRMCLVNMVVVFWAHGLLWVLTAKVWEFEALKGPKDSKMMIFCEFITAWITFPIIRYTNLTHWHQIIVYEEILVLLYQQYLDWSQHMYLGTPLHRPVLAVWLIASQCDLRQRSTCEPGSDLQRRCRPFPCLFLGPFY